MFNKNYSESDLEKNQGGGDNLKCTMGEGKENLTTPQTLLCTRGKVQSSVSED